MQLDRNFGVCIVGICKYNLVFVGLVWRFSDVRCYGVPIHISKPNVGFDLLEAILSSESARRLFSNDKFIPESLLEFLILPGGQVMRL